MRRRLGDFTAPGRLIGCLLAALVLLGIGANAVVELVRLDARGVRVTATVLSVPSSLSRPGMSFTARYSIAGGQQVTTEISRYAVEPAIGDMVEIIYDRDEPTVAKTVDAGETPWLPGIAYGGGAVLVSWIGLRRQRES